MIVSYRAKRTRDFISGKRVKAFSGLERSAENKLAQLDSATSLADLRRPGNRLETLKGDRKGQYSIRLMINGACALNGRQSPRGL